MRRLLLLLNTGTSVSRALLVSHVPTHTELEPEMRWSNDSSTAQFTTLMAIRTAVRGKRHRATEQTKLLVCEIILIDSSKCDVTSSTACVFFLRDVICWKRRARCSNKKNMST